jgi:hypothetical protein
MGLWLARAGSDKDLWLSGELNRKLCPKLRRIAGCQLVCDKVHDKFPELLTRVPFTFAKTVNRTVVGTYNHLSFRNCR